jgi:phospholipase C
VPAQRAAWEADVRAHDFAPLAQAGEMAAVAAVPLQSDAEAGVIAAHRQLARWARNAQAAPGPAGRRRRQGGKPAPA